MSTSATLNISTVDFDQLQIRVKVRGNPLATYGGCTITGIFQPEMYTLYWQNPDIKIPPGVSPVFQQAISFNTNSRISTDAPLTFGRLSTWNWYSFRFSLIPQNTFRIAYFNVKYYADSDDAVPGPSFHTELQIDQIKLEGIRFH